MREFASPSTYDVPAAANLTDDLLTNASRNPEAVLFARRVGGDWADVTAARFADEVRAVARGLVASGIGAGDRVALLSANRYEWTLLDYALWFAGAVTVPVYETSPDELVSWILADADVRAAVVGTAGQRERVTAADTDRRLEHLWTFDEDAVGTLARAGVAVREADLEARRSAVRADTLATVIYTSGTTGRPRGCRLTHGNFLAELGVAVPELDALFEGPDAATLLFLPLSHVFARVVQLGAVRARVRLGHSSDPRRLAEDLRSFRPTFVLGVPRVFEKLFTSASQDAAAEGRGRTFDKATETAIAFSRACDDGRVGRLLRLRHRTYERPVYAPLREALGGRCRYAVSGGAPLGERLGHYYRGIGVTVLEGYGLTETTAAVTVNRPDAMKIGTVGRPLGGSAVRVSEDGELLVRGPQVFGGYWRDDEDTAASFTADGWLRTGDVGEIDDEGFVRVTGRQKEILVTAGGKNVAPAMLEDLVRAHPLVSQCLVVGDGRPFVAALVTLDAEAASRWAREHGRRPDVAALAEDEQVHAELQLAVDAANRSVSQAEAIRRFAVLADDWTEEDGQLTPSLKIRRSVVAREHRADIEALYLRRTD